MIGGLYHHYKRQFCEISRTYNYALVNGNEMDGSGDGAWFLVSSPDAYCWLVYEGYSFRLADGYGSTS